MATFTSIYGLHQWAPEDNFLRTDFNEDLKKIDEALGEKAAQSSVLTLATEVQQKTQAVEGQFTGDGAYTKTINLGHKPVVVWCWSDISSGFSVQNYSQGSIELAASGFTVYKNDNQNTNQSGRKYTYLAFYR